MNAVDEDKFTGLHIAVQCDHVDVAKVLLQSGADATLLALIVSRHFTTEPLMDMLTLRKC